MRYFAIAAGFALAVTALFAMGAAQAEDAVMSDGKCWTNTSNGNWEWAACHVSHGKARHHK
jgi:hypothetical protein